MPLFNDGRQDIKIESRSFISLHDAEKKMRKFSKHQESLKTISQTGMIVPLGVSGVAEGGRDFGGEGGPFANAQDVILVPKGPAGILENIPFDQLSAIRKGIKNASQKGSN